MCNFIYLDNPNEVINYLNGYKIEIFDNGNWVKFFLTKHNSHLIYTDDNIKFRVVKNENIPYKNKCKCGCS